MEKSKCVDATSEKVRKNISDDLVFFILSKLPLKSLKRFGCVRKSWALLFESPNFLNNFISNRHSYYNDTSLLLHHAVLPAGFQEEEYPGLNFSLYLLSGERFENRVKLEWPNPFQENNPCFYILDSGSVNGTLCLYQQQERVVLWNPATQEFKVIPPSPVESVPPYRFPFVHLHGFGYDHVRDDDYKLIRHVEFFELTDFELGNLGVLWEDVPWEDISYDPVWEIYSLRSNSWRKLDVDMPTCCCSVTGVRLYMDGMCHWYNDEEYLVSFDLSNEVFFTTSIPLDIPSDIDDNFDIDLVWRHLVVLNGSIALISNYVDTTTFHISILGQLGVKESWTKLLIVGPWPCIEHPIGAGKKGDIFFRKKDDELARFDLSTQMTEDLGVKGARFLCHIVIYKESLLPIGGINN